MQRKLLARTSARLRDLLINRADYALRWQLRIDRQHTYDIHQSAVCHVIAEYLWDSGMHEETDLELPRKLKDRVCRALSGQSMSRATLRWFIEAFRMSSADAAELIQLSSPARAGDTMLNGVPLEPGILPRRQHATVSLHELHRLGADGLPDSHRTLHVIRALEPMDRYPYLFDSDAATVHVVRGGRAGRPYSLENGLTAVDIELAEPLRPGDTQSFEYITRFWYRTPPLPQYRRAAPGRIDSLDLRVQFHPLRQPAQVWWSVWRDLESPPIYSDQVPIDSDGGVHRFLPHVESAIVGFRWTPLATRS